MRRSWENKEWSEMSEEEQENYIAYHDNNGPKHDTDRMIAGFFLLGFI